MRTRRGLSTVVGMVFAIIALSSTVVYVTYSMNTLDQYNQTVMSKNQVLLNQAQEKPILVSATYSPNSKFNLTLTNIGNVPINFTKIWIQNTTIGIDKTYEYHLSNALVSPGGVLKNIGQNIPGTYKNSHPYSIKLVTSRGNALQFLLNSVSTTPLNIQLSTIPPNVPSAFTTQLVMVVTNNSTGILANIVPNTPTKVTSGQGASTATSCALGALNSNTSPTLQVGQTAIFSWPLTITGTPGTICTYQASLQGATQTVRATVTSTVVTLVPATTYSQYSGILTINYTSFRWAELGSTGNWNTGWQFPSLINAAFKINMTNNNSTGTMWISKNTVLVYYSSRISPSQQPTKFYLVNSTNPATLVSTAYGSCNGQSDYCLGILPGQTVTLYFAATAAGGFAPQQFPAADVNTTFLLAFGKFAATQTGSGTLYAQNVPYIAAITT